MTYRIKPIVEMTEAELRELIKDPLGPDYAGTIAMAREQLRRVTRQNPSKM